MEGGGSDANEGQVEKLMSTRYYAACDVGHSYWEGKSHDTFEEAEIDRKFHDTDKHGGSESAVVLEY